MKFFIYSPHAEQLHERIVSYGCNIIVVLPLESVQFISTCIVDVCAGEQQRHVFVGELKPDIEYDIQPPKHCCCGIICVDTQLLKLRKSAGNWLTEHISGSIKIKKKQNFFSMKFYTKKIFTWNFNTWTTTCTIGW